MTHTIESVVEGVIMLMQNHGISDKTIKFYRNNHFKPIILYCHQHGNGFYSSELTSAYLTERTKQLAAGTIKQHYYRSIKRMVNYTDLYATSGKIDFRKPGKPKYIISEDSEKVLQRILEK